MSEPRSHLVAVLFVSERGPYASDPRFDAWGVTRDARRYNDQDPAVVHSPCKRWGRFAEGGPVSKTRYRIGDDEGCFAHGLSIVRRNGGVLEHPQGSYAWPFFGLPAPPERGWSPSDAWGGRSTYIDQGAYGHPAKKPTWLYAVLPAFPKLNWNRIWGRPHIGGEGYHSARERARAKASGKFKPQSERVGGEWLWRTPDLLKDALYEMAVSCIGWKPRQLQTQAVLA